MFCPECGGVTEVLETRQLKRHNVVKRRYECGMQHRFTTYEILDRRVAPRTGKGIKREADQMGGGDEAAWIRGLGSQVADFVRKRGKRDGNDTPVH